MAALVKEIARRVIAEASKRQIALTPDNYHMLFCEVATEMGVATNECKRLENYISKLDPIYQSELKRLGVRSEGELFAFISARLNRSNPSEQLRIIQLLTLLIKRIAQSGAKLHNSEVRNLCAITIDTLNRRMNAQNISIIIEKWFDFVTNYNDDFLKKLEVFGVKRTDDFGLILKKLLSAKRENSSDNTTIQALAELMIEALSPSISPVLGEQVKLIKKIKEDPSLLMASSTQNQIRQNIAQRVERDGAEMSSRVAILKAMLDDINAQISGFNSDFKNSQSAITSSKNAIESVATEADYSKIKTKLITILSDLQHQTSDFSDKLNKKEQTINELKSKVSELQNRPQATDIRTDPLTNLGSKYGFEAELVGVESIYMKYSLDYSVCFFGIDDIKNITQKYGEESSDTILITLSNILRDNCAQNSFISRYDGVSFAVLLANTSQNDAVLFAQKIIDIVASFKFLYKGDNINITASCGVASRLKSKNENDTLKKAIFALYEAKESGANCVKSSQL